MGKKTRNHNPRNFSFKKEMKRHPPRPELRPFRFVAREGDVLGEEAVYALLERGFDAAVYSGTPPSDGDHACVFLTSSTVARHRNSTRLAVYANPWQSWKRGPFVILLRKRRTKDFATAVLVAAERYAAWGRGISKGELAPCPVRYNSLTNARRRQFEDWRRAVGEEVGMPARETNLLIEGLRAVATRRTVSVKRDRNRLVSN